jgi:DNA replication protein
MKVLQGFSDSESNTAIPDGFFELLSEFQEVDELKVLLYVLWRLDHLEGSFRALPASELEHGILDIPEERLRPCLAKSVARGLLLRAEHGERAVYLLNTPRGRESARAFAAGGQDRAVRSAGLPLARPGVFRVYEENIGPLTPLIADALRDAEQTYGEEWVNVAMELAVKHNKRSWKYCEAILKRWKEEGRAEKQNRRDDPSARQRDVEEKIRKFIQG